MATGSYSHYGFLIDEIPSSQLVIGSDLDMNNYSITNVNLLSAATGVFDNVIVNNDLSVTGCISGGAGLPANLCEGAIVGKALEMPVDQPLNTTNFLNITTINNSGPPLSSPLEGSVAYTKTDDKFWVFDGTSWVQVNAAGVVPNLAAVLAVGNQTGANNIIITTGQQLTYQSGARIGINNTTTGTTSPTGINIGDNNTISNGIDTIAIGRQASTSTAGAVVIGERSLSLGGVAIGSVAQATGASAVCIGQQSTTGTGTLNTAVGHLARLGDANTSCIAVGSNIISAPSCTQTILIGSGVGTGASSTTNLVSVGTQANVQNSQTVKIGRGLGGTGVNNTAVGDSIVLQGTADNSTVVGSAITVPTGTSGTTMVGAQALASASTATALGRSVTAAGVSSLAAGHLAQSNATNSVALGHNASVNATATDSVALGEAASVAAGHTLSASILGTTTNKNQIRLGQALHTVSVPGFVFSEQQESGGIQTAVNQTIGVGAGTTRIVGGSTIYNFSFDGLWIYGDNVNNRINLRPNSLYLVTYGLRYAEGTNHTNSPDLTFTLTYFDGVTAIPISADTKSYPVSGPGSLGGHSFNSQIIKTNANATQWAACDLNANSSNGTLIISDFRLQAAKIN